MTTAENGTEALRLAREQPFGLAELAARIGTVRRKLGRPELIHTQRAVGYCLRVREGK